MAYRNLNTKISRDLLQITCLIGHLYQIDSKATIHLRYENNLLVYTL